MSLLGKEYHTTIEHERRVDVFFMLAHVWHDTMVGGKSGKRLGGGMRRYRLVVALLRLL